MGTREFTVVIATAGRPTLLRRTLESLAACARPAGYAGTAVVENGGREGAEPIVADFATTLGARYVFVPQGNKSLALNRVMETLSPDGFVFFTDDDVRFDPAVLMTYVDAAAADGGGAGRCFGGPTACDYEVQPPEWVRRHFPVSARGWEPDAAERASPNLSFLGFNWGAFVADLTAAGGFNPDRGPGAKNGATGQESEMQSRLRARGVRPVYLPQAWVWHYIPRERSTAEWAIDRAFRHGVQAGMQAPAASLRVRGCPLWVYARLAKGAARVGWARIAGDDAARLAARTTQNYNRGLARGFRTRDAAMMAAPAASQPASQSPPPALSRTSTS